MLRPLLLATMIATTGHAQSTGQDKPLVLLTRIDIHRMPVRFRPADSAAPWTEGVALRRDRATFAVVDSRGQMILAPLEPPLRIEAFAPEYAGGKYMLRGAIIGGLLAAGAVILDASTCHDDHSEGPPCGIVIVLTPAAAAIGSLVGGAIGAIIPRPDWQPVARFMPTTVGKSQPH